MRKLFVIALMVALIPFATGCRIDGLWGFDDNGGSTAATPVTPTVNLTTATFNAALNTYNVPASALTIYVKNLAAGYAQTTLKSTNLVTFATTYAGAQDSTNQWQYSATLSSGTTAGLGYADAIGGLTKLVGTFTQIIFNQNLTNGATVEVWNTNSNTLLGTTVVGTATTPVATTKNSVTLNENVTLPSTAVDTSANVKWFAIPLTIGTGTNQIVIYPYTFTSASGTITLKYKKVLLVSALTAAIPAYNGNSNVQIPATISIAGVPINVTIAAVAAVTSTNTETAPTTITTITITGTFATGFSVTVTITVPTGSSPTGTVPTATTTPVASSTTSLSFWVDSIAVGAVKIGGDLTAPAAVATTTPTFTLTFGAPLANASTATWTAVATNLTTGNVVNLDQTSMNIIATSPSSMSITLTVAPTALTLRPGDLYSVQFTSSTLKSTTGGTLTMPQICYFSCYTALVSWTGSDGTLVAVATPTIKLTFTAPVAQVIPAGTVMIKRFANSATTTPELSVTVGADGVGTVTRDTTSTNVVNVAINQNLVANKYYTVTYVSGQLLDANGVAITVPTAPISFTTAAQ